MAEQLDRSDIGQSQQWHDRFISLVTHYEQQVFSFVLSLVGDAVRAEKVSRDVFVSLFHSRENHDESAPFEVSLYRRAVDASRDQLSSVERQSSEELCLEKVIAESVSCSALLAREMDPQDSVNTLVSRLPIEYRAVFLLHDVRRMGFDKVGAIMSMTPGEARQVLHRARLMLQRWVAKDRNLDGPVAESTLGAKGFRTEIGLGETETLPIN